MVKVGSGLAQLGLTSLRSRQPPPHSPQDQMELEPMDVSGITWEGLCSQNPQHTP